MDPTGFLATCSLLHYFIIIVMIFISERPPQSVCWLIGRQAMGFVSVFMEKSSLSQSGLHESVVKSNTAVMLLLLWLSSLSLLPQLCCWASLGFSQQENTFDILLLVTTLINIQSTSAPGSVKNPQRNQGRLWKPDVKSGSLGMFLCVRMRCDVSQVRDQCQKRPSWQRDCGFDSHSDHPLVKEEMIWGTHVCQFTGSCSCALG